MLALELGVVACLIVLNGFFAMAELALVSSRRPRLSAMAEKGSTGAKAALRMVRGIRAGRYSKADRRQA